jgi:hypothetical protein
MTIEEASDFWDNHSLADFPTREVEIEYSPDGLDTEDSNASAVVIEPTPGRRINSAT